MEKLRIVVDELERIIPKNNWPMPTYADILFYC
jgi:glutamine synthetase type III